MRPTPKDLLLWLKDSAWMTRRLPTRRTDKPQQCRQIQQWRSRKSFEQEPQKRGFVPCPSFYPAGWVAGGEIHCRCVNYAATAGPAIPSAVEQVFPDYYAAAGCGELT